jgi:hypothetical protein
MTFKKNWRCDILKQPESTYVNLLQPRPRSWDCDNHVKIKFEHINPKKKENTSWRQIQNKPIAKKNNNSIWHLKKKNI